MRPTCNFRLQQFAIPDGKTGPQTVDMLVKRILSLGASHAGTFQVDCDTYMTTPMTAPLFGKFQPIKPYILTQQQKL